jgi:hypothetical protein
MLNMEGYCCTERCKPPVMLNMEDYCTAVQKGCKPPVMLNMEDYCCTEGV